MLSLNDILSFVLFDSGQFMLAGVDTLENLQINKKAAWTSWVQPTLQYYQAYRPYEYQISLEFAGNNYTFTTAQDGYVPEYIVSVTPVGIGAVAVLGNVRSPFDLRNPYVFVWKYEKPTIFFPSIGLYEIKACRYFTYVEELDPDTNVFRNGTVAELSVGDLPGTLGELLVARFLIAVGRSRRAFTYGEFPITTDSEDLVREGQELLERAKESIETQKSKWWTAVKH